MVINYNLIFFIKVLYKLIIISQKELIINYILDVLFEIYDIFES